MMPVLFVSHGAPTLPLQKDAAAHRFFSTLTKLSPQPRAIVVVSAHYEAPVFTVTGAPKLGTIHDFSGFPAELYALRYEPPADPTLAQKVAAMVAAAGLPVAVDTTRGIDHGAWTPLILGYPGAGVPVLQVSLRHGLDASEHLALGRALAPLRNDNVLLIGSGGAVHNLRRLDWNDQPAPPSDWAGQFQQWVDETLAVAGKERQARLADWEHAPHARIAHPREEHLLPLHVIAGAAGDDAARKVHDSWQMRDMSLAAYAFGSLKA